MSRWGELIPHTEDDPGCLCGCLDESADETPVIVEIMGSRTPQFEGEVIANRYATKDSGARVVHDSGMVRDTNQGKPRFDLMIPKGIPYEELYLTRIAQLYARGAEKYDARNWEKANSQEELDRALESAFRHFMQWFAGELDEDHAAAVFFNINEVETIRHKLRVQKDTELKKIDYSKISIPRSMVEGDI